MSISKEAPVRACVAFYSSLLIRSISKLLFLVALLGKNKCFLHLQIPLRLLPARCFQGPVLSTILNFFSPQDSGHRAPWTPPPRVSHASLEHIESSFSPGLISKIFTPGFRVRGMQRWRPCPPSYQWVAGHYPRKALDRAVHPVQIPGGWIASFHRTHLCGGLCILIPVPTQVGAMLVGLSRRWRPLPSTPSRLSGNVHDCQLGAGLLAAAMSREPG